MTQVAVGQSAKILFGETLKKIRISRGYTQEVFAKMLGIKQAELSQIEAGKRGFSPESVSKFSEALGCEPHQLLHFEENQNAELQQLRSMKADLERAYGPNAIERMLAVPALVQTQYSEQLNQILGLDSPTESSPAPQTEAPVSSRRKPEAG